MKETKENREKERIKLGKNRREEEKYKKDNRK